MILRRLTNAFRKQNWFTVAVETLIVVLGMERGRALWGLTSGYFNPGFTKMVAKMITDMPPIDYWDKLQDIK